MIQPIQSVHYLRIDEKEMHLEESKQSLQDGMGNENIFHAILLHGGVHSDLQSGEYQRAQAKN